MDDGMGMMQPQSMMPQQPIQAAIAEPAYMPPQMPQSLQMQPAQPPGFFLGGLINLAPTMGSAEASEDPAAPPAPAARPNPARAIGIGPSTVRSAEPVDIGATAGTVVVPPKVNAIGVDAFVERIGAKLDTAPPEEVADEIVKTAVEEPTGDLRFDLAKTLEEMTGDSSAYEKNIDQLNRGIIGAAIAAGTSARATENIAKGLLVGMEGARATEERRAGDARALQLKALEVRAAEQAAREAGAKAETEAEGKLIKDMRDTFDTMYTTVFDAGVFAVPEGGGELNDYATQVARDKVVELYGAENAAKLFGSASSSEEPPPAAAQRTGTPPTLEQYTAMVKAKNPNVAMTGEEFEARYNSWVAQNYAGS
jgi:hypothetical protein